MNILLTFGLLLITAYVTGLLCDKAGLPKIIGYILTGIIFSPNSTGFFADHGLISTMRPLMEVSLAFITFEVGGELKWSKIKQHEKEIITVQRFRPLLQGVSLQVWYHLVYH
jgi:Kef-type K+ transport system membrane component KefB